ncbi:hypothetical protein D3C78_1887570 [compost metagenome]
MGQLLEMERQRIGGDAQLRGQGAGREAFGAGDHQRAEYAQPGFMGQRGEGTYGLGFLHEPIIQQLLNH